MALSLNHALAYALLMQGGDRCTIGKIISNIQAGTLASLTIDVSLTSMGKMPPAAADVEGPSPADFVGPALTLAIWCPFFSTLKRLAGRGLPVSIEASSASIFIG